MKCRLPDTMSGTGEIFISGAVCAQYFSNITLISGMHLYASVVALVWENIMFFLGTSIGCLNNR